MPQLDLNSYFSAATTLILLFLSLVFILHTYFLPKLATCLKFRKKMQLKQDTQTKVVNHETFENQEPFLEMAQTYINEMEKIVKVQNTK